jgi:hypothetical protein
MRRETSGYGVVREGRSPSMPTQSRSTRPKSYGMLSERAVVHIEGGGEVAVSLYTHGSGPDAGKVNVYVNSLDGTWTGIQLDTSGRILAVAHAATRDETWHRLDPESNP